MMKKTVALILTLLLCALCVVSCAKNDDPTPDGMKSATLAGEPFLLYVPEGWSLNTASGTSSAIFNSAKTILVKAKYDTPADPAMTVDQYVDACAARYAQKLASFTVTAREASLLGGADAVKLSYTMMDGTEPLTCFQITATYKGDMVSLHGYCATELYEARKADFDSIIKEFVLCEKSDPNGTSYIDKNTPEGFEIASAKQIEYRFYVPTAWVCDAESGASEAYYPESGKSNVTVSSYSPELSISVPDYFLECEASYKASLPGYERIAESTRTVAGRSAYSYTYRITVDGVEMTVMQTLLSYNSMIYSITYTALCENFDLHLADVEAMLNVFTFR